MSDVLLDNSYLHSAYRCLIKRATSNNDIVNFYRLLAEIISHKIIYIKVNKDGPVIEKAIEIIDFFKNKSNKKFEIQFVDSKKIDYNHLISKVTSRLKNINISSIFKNSIPRADNSPEFSVEIHPDTTFHEWLISDSNAVPRNFSTSNDGTFLPILIGQELGFKDQYKKISKKNWSLSKSIALAAQMRAFGYIEMGKQLNLTYIPSATRGYYTNYNIKSPSLRNMLFSDVNTFQDFKRSFTENANIISGVILRNDCIPINSLCDAFDLRERTKQIRNIIYKKPFLKSGDSLSLYKYSKIKELCKIKDEYLANGKLIFGIEDLSIGLSSTSVDPTIDIGIPLIKSVLQVIDWGRRQRLLNSIKALILPITQINFSNPTKQLKNLQLNSGIDE